MMLFLKMRKHKMPSCITSLDQPERLPYELIANAQNKLVADGIEFNYVIVNHGSGVVITKKPVGITDTEALTRVQNALIENAVSSSAIVFDLK